MGQIPAAALETAHRHRHAAVIDQVLGARLDVQPAPRACSAYCEGQIEPGLERSLAQVLVQHEPLAGRRPALRTAAHGALRNGSIVR